MDRVYSNISCFNLGYSNLLKRCSRYYYRWKVMQATFNGSLKLKDTQSTNHIKHFRINFKSQVMLIEISKCFFFYVIVYINHITTSIRNVKEYKIQGKSCISNVWDTIWSSKIFFPWCVTHVYLKGWYRSFESNPKGRENGMQPLCADFLSKSRIWNWALLITTTMLSFLEYFQVSSMSV